MAEIDRVIETKVIPIAPELVRSVGKVLRADYSLSQQAIEDDLNHLAITATEGSHQLFVKKIRDAHTALGGLVTDLSRVSEASVVYKREAGEEKGMWALIYSAADTDQANNQGAEVISGEDAIAFDEALSHAVNSLVTDYAYAQFIARKTTSSEAAERARHLSEVSKQMAKRMDLFQGATRIEETTVGKVINIDVFNSEPAAFQDITFKTHAIYTRKPLAA